MEEVREAVPAFGAAPVPSARSSTISRIPAEPAPVVRLAGQFPTAAAALVCAGTFDGSGEVTFGRSAPTGTWWVFAESTLPAGREVITAARGKTFVELDGTLVPDKGWGATPAPPSVKPLGQPGPETRIDVLELIRTAGLHQYAAPAPAELVVLVPGSSLTTVIHRALDLTLDVGYRLVRLDPLFPGNDPPPSLNGTETAATTMFEVRLRSPADPLPRAFLAALDRDPCVLPCRRSGDHLLIQHQMAAPLADRQLARLAEHDALGGSWVLADPAFGCVRLRPHDPQGEFRDGAGLVRLADHHRLTAIDPGWAALGSDPAPAPPALQLVPAPTRGVAVDAALLDESDLRCLQALLEGGHLADLAMLIRGRDRHLMVAPGSLLERLPIGEPLYRLGPGPLYLPLGYRTQPLLPPSARQALFGTDPNTAVVLQAETTLTFALDHREPVWALWAGAPPPVDRQLPPDALAALTAADAQTTPVAPPPPPDRPLTAWTGPHPSGREPGEIKPSKPK
ncbi:MAG: hypothetical protein ACRDTG_02880 [Pseudonocardiaceae bacterium]